MGAISADSRDPAVPLIPPELVAGLDVIDKFIKVGKELADLSTSVLPQYPAAAASLYQISQKLLSGNENIARWLFKFQYFDFAQSDARKAFNELCRDYKIMKMGPERQALKFKCGDIWGIYQQEIEAKIGKWFTSSRRADDAKDTFVRLASADGAMIEFIDRNVLSQLDAFVAEAETLVDANDLSGAEAARLRFKAAAGETTRRLEQFNSDLSDLILQFAKIGRVPVTVGN